MKKTYTNIAYIKLNVLAVFILFIALNHFLYAEKRSIGVTNQFDIDRVAFIVGNSNYQNVSILQNPTNDSVDISYALKRCKFEIISLQNADYKTMRKGIEDFSHQMKKNGVALFYYAGHAVQVKGHNYLIPVDAEIKREYQLDTQCIKVNEILGAMEYAQNRMNIIILDACRDNPFRSLSRSAKGGLARIDAGKGTLIVYATAPGKTASDGKDRNGIFTGALIRHVYEPLEIAKLLRKVRQDVIDMSNGYQVPWESSSLTGEFYFVFPDRKISKPTSTKRIYANILDGSAVSQNFETHYQSAIRYAEEGTESSLSKALDELKRVIPEATENEAIFLKISKIIKIIKDEKDGLERKRKAKEAEEAQRLIQIALEKRRIAEEKRRKAEEEARIAREQLIMLERKRKKKEAQHILKEKKIRVVSLLKELKLYVDLGDYDQSYATYWKAYNILPTYIGLREYSNKYFSFVGYATMRMIRTGNENIDKRINKLERYCYVAFNQYVENFSVIIKGKLKEKYTKILEMKPIPRKITAEPETKILLYPDVKNIKGINRFHDGVNSSFDKYLKTVSSYNDIELVVFSCIEEFIIKEYLEKRRSKCLLTVMVYYLSSNSVGMKYVDIDLNKQVTDEYINLFKYAMIEATDEVFVLKTETITPQPNSWD